MSEITDDDLVRMYVEGDVDAFDALFDRYHASVYNLATMMLHDIHAAEEIMQETFVSVLQALPGYSPRGRFPAWLMRIARNRCLNRLGSAWATRACETSPSRSSRSSVV